VPEPEEKFLTPRQRELQQRMEQVSGVAQREVEIKDASAIRALAHEARQRVINLLYSEQRPYTSTQLAELTGLTPSAMSYHLRALERWGVVQRAEGGDDARNRPWRAAGTGLRISGEGESTDAAQDALRKQLFDSISKRARAVRALPPEEPANYVGLGVAELWLTDDQVETLALMLDRAVLEMQESGWVNEPGPDKTRISYIYSLLPDPYKRDD
jgi:DNA-binding MarR family transcriptional regulator